VRNINAKVGQGSS